MGNNKFENPEPNRDDNSGDEEFSEMEFLTPENANRLLVGEFEMRPVQDIKSGDIIVQFGNKIKVLEIIPKKNDMYDIIVEGKEGKNPRWENLNSKDASRILIAKKEQEEK